MQTKSEISKRQQIREIGRGSRLGKQTLWAVNPWFMGERLERYTVVVEPIQRRYDVGTVHPSAVARTTAIHHAAAAAA